MVTTRSKGAITSITLTPGNPTTLSNTLGYYLAGRQYTFTVNVKDPAATAWADITEVRLNIPNGPAIELWVNPSGTGAQTINYVSGVTSDVSANIPGTDTYNDFDVQFTITVLWNIAESSWAASRVITAQAVSSNTLSTTQNVSYGVCSSIRFNNFAQDLDALDGYVSPWHNAFNVTGAIVYDVPGATNSDKVYFVNGGSELTSVRLLHNGVDTTGMSTPLTADSAFTNDANDDVSITVSAAFFNSNSLALSTLPWTVQAYFSTGSGSEVSSNSLNITNERVEVTSVRLINGGGTDLSPVPPPEARVYNRSVNVSGVQLQVYARMQGSTGTVIGNTTVRVRDITDTIDYDVVINNGTNVGTVNLSAFSYPTTPATAGNTNTHTYQVTNISGSVTDSNQNVYARILQPGNNGGSDTIVYWDNADQPGNNGSSFTTFQATPWSSTADSFTINWNAIPNGTTFDGDFYTYRIYYQLPSTVWNMLDVSTGGIYTALGTYTTNTIDISGLAPLTDYPFRVSAVDVYGNEVVLADMLTDTASTKPSSLTVSISDGITTYEDSSFTGNQLATARPVRKSSIKVTLYLVTGGNEPDEINLIIGDNSLEPATILGSTYYTIPSTKKSSNTWVAYIPSTHTLMSLNESIRFIVETKYQGTSTYVDHDADYNPAEQLPAGEDYNNWEYTFTISKPTTFSPWPTRILNNVITDKNPVAYPAYYLTEDANVTIRVYDIKGRPVVTLLDNAFRRSGQNIKENGWRGINKSSRMLGPGLYYMHFRAKSSSSGKVILNKFKKVVIAK